MLNKAIIIGTIRKKELQYKTKSDGGVVPVCEVEIIEDQNILKITFFYEKAEEISERVSIGDVIYVECKIRGAKDRYYSMDLWGIRYKVITHSNGG